MVIIYVSCLLGRFSLYSIFSSVKGTINLDKKTPFCSRLQTCHVFLYNNLYPLSILLQKFVTFTMKNREDTLHSQRNLKTSFIFRSFVRTFTPIIEETTIYK